MKMSSSFHSTANSTSNSSPFFIMRPCRQLAPGIYQENADSELTELFNDCIICIGTIYFKSQNNFVVYQKCNRCSLFLTILNRYYPLTTYHSQIVPRVVPSSHDCDICVQKLRQSFLAHDEYRQDRRAMELPDDWPHCRDQQDDLYRFCTHCYQMIVTRPRNN